MQISRILLHPINSARVDALKDWCPEKLMLVTVLANVPGIG